MAKLDLNGKTVMIATADQFYANYPKLSLEELGATVVFSERPPIHTANIQSIADEVQQHTPPIDALVIYNSNIALYEPKETALALAKQFSQTLPVIVCDSCSNADALALQRGGGAKYLNSMDVLPDEFAANVADAIAQRGKSGKGKK